MEKADTRPLMVTIRCTTFNQKAYIRQCLDGFVMQKTNFRFEAIVHDDASTDGTTDIVREYAAKYPEIIKPIFEKENQYSKQDGSLRRIMDENTYGKYIAICEGDDYWTDSLKLQKQVDFLEMNPEYSMCFHRAQIKNEIEKRHLKIMCSDIEDREYDPNELYQKWIVPTASICAKRETLNVKSIGRDRVVYSDIVYILDCAKLGKIRGMKDEMSVYRIQSEGVTNDKKRIDSDVPRFVGHYKFIKENYPFIKKRIANKKIARAYLNRRHYQTSWYNYFRDVVLALYYNPLIFMEKIEFTMNSFIYGE